MIELTIPGHGTLKLHHLVFDVNGTLALDGKLLEGVAQAIHRLSEHVTIHLVTANTFGKQDAIDRELGVTSLRLTQGDMSAQKANYVRKLGEEHVAAIGQGANDAEMLATAALGIAVLSREGLAICTLQSADLVVPDILAALELFEKPLRLVATLRK